MKQGKTVFRHYVFALAVTAVVLGFVGFGAGVAALWPVCILAVIEITFSFDNAVLNTDVLSRMARRWRAIFLTAGIAIAVFGVRLLLPLVLVSATTGETISQVFALALHYPDEYAKHLQDGYPIIAAFGGVFLLMIGLRFLAEERDVKWIPFIEHAVSRPDRPWLIPIAGALLAAAVITLIIKPNDTRLLLASLAGMATFLVMKVISVMLESGQPNNRRHDWLNFLYLELLDASFSFDGVIAAFAITKEVLLITAGLGIGALYVRSMTVHMLERNTISNYRYLVHGAHYAIIALGLLLIVTIRMELPEWLTGLIGIVIIGWALKSSINHNHKLQRAAA